VTFTGAVAGAAQVVYYNRCAFSGQSQCVRAAQTATSTRYERNFAVKHSHSVSPFGWVKEMLLCGISLEFVFSPLIPVFWGAG
jgi:hypothetical protein